MKLYDCLVKKWTPMPNNRIVIIDDCPEIRRLAGAVLSEQCEVVMASSGEEGIRRSVLDRPDCILLDVDLPLQNGFEVFSRLHLDARTKPIPVVFLTSDFHAPDIARSFAAGAADYVIKPFDGHDLLTRVLAAIETRRPSSLADGEIRAIPTLDDVESTLHSDIDLARRTSEVISATVCDVDGLRELNRLHGERCWR